MKMKRHGAVYLSTGFHRFSGSIPDAERSRHIVLATAILLARAFGSNGSGHHSPSCHCRPHFKHVELHPYQGVNNSIKRLRIVLQSGQLPLVILLSWARGAWMCNFIFPPYKIISHCPSLSRRPYDKRNRNRRLVRACPCSCSNRDSRSHTDSSCLRVLGGV